MPGLTEQEIAQAKQMNLYQYMQLCEPDNFKPEGPGQFRHKGHSSLTFAEDGSWTYFKTKATGRTALNYLIAVEGVSFVEAVREINRIQGGVRPSFQPVKAPPLPAEKKPAKEYLQQWPIGTFSPSACMMILMMTDSSKIYASRRPRAARSQETLACRMFCRNSASSPFRKRLDSVNAITRTRNPACNMIFFLSMMKTGYHGKIG